MSDKLSTLVHDRQLLGEEMLVYPVKSRRSGGLSIGVNTSPNKKCNFDCVYCEVDRSTSQTGLLFDLNILEEQLDRVITSILNGDLFEGEKIMDIALSGDGEPTQLKNFADLIALIIRLKAKHGLQGAKIVTITNATGLRRKTVMSGIEMMTPDDELWVKLDAGSEDFFKTISRTRIALSWILENILIVSRKKPVCLQTCFLNIRGNPPTDSEIAEYCNRVNRIIGEGGMIKQIQIYTVSRMPTSDVVTALTQSQLQQIGDIVSCSLDEKPPVTVYY